ncbi:MAG: TIGR04086 family membrane protein [Clostridia bacterium]|nr:TIGR04086 family membrane protein [Clostridia bacterium]
METAREQSKPLPAVIRAVLFASLASILLIVATALCVWQNVMGETAVYIAIPLIKAVCASIAAITVMRSNCRRRVLFAGAAGLLYIAFAFAVYCLMSAEFSLSASFLLDMLIGTAAATLTALIIHMLPAKD